MKHISRTPIQGIRAWAEWQVVALFLSGSFVRRYLSPLVVQSVFRVAPHWLLQIVACLLCTQLMYLLSVKRLDRRSVRISLRTPVLRNALFLSKSVNGNISLCTMEPLWYCCHTPPGWDTDSFLHCNLCRNFPCLVYCIHTWCLSRYTRSMRAEATGSSQHCCVRKPEEKVTKPALAATPLVWIIKYSFVRSHAFYYILEFLQYADKARFLWVYPSCCSNPQLQSSSREILCLE